MTRIRILSPGKIKEKWLEEALQEYQKRLTSYATLELIFPKDEKTFLKQLPQEKNLIFLSPQGQLFSSELFANYLFKKIESGGAQISFAIGGPEGFSPTLLENKPLISLSPLTFTHQMARLLLLEQIYRSYEIQKGTNYHK